MTHFYVFAVPFPETREVEIIEIDAPNREAAWKQARAEATDLYGEEPASRMTLEVEV